MSHLPSPALLPVIAENLKRLRSERDLSVEALAARGQVTELALRRIEKGAQLPTLDALWALANALDVTFGELIQAQPEKAPSTPRVARRSLLPSTQGRRQTELHELTLAPHSEGLSPARDPHTVENLLVTAGELVVFYEDQSRVLAVGEELAVPAHVERRYLNRGDQPAIAYAKLAPSAHA